MRTRTKWIFKKTEISYLEDKLVKPSKNIGDRTDDKKKDDRPWRKGIYTISIKYWYSRKREEKETDVIINDLIKEDTLKNKITSDKNGSFYAKQNYSKGTQLKTHLSKILK